MKLSIIIVSYNEKQYLSEAIDSCLSQMSNQEYEIIIGDDGSDDGSLDLIKWYAEKYENIKWFVMERGDVHNVIPSIRVSNVLKKAFTISQGEYLMIMSGDDYLCDKYKCAKQSEFLDINLKYDSCYTDYKMFWDDGTERIFKKKASLSPNVFWGARYIHISCFLFRRKILDNILLRFCDDTGLLFSILKTGKSKHISSLSFGYRQRDKSIMQEADQMELCILEILLAQDVMLSGGFKIGTFSRFSIPHLYVFLHRKRLGEERYSKFVESSKMYPKDFLGKIKKWENLTYYDKIKVYFYLLKGIISKCLMISMAVIEVIFNYIILKLGGERNVKFKF